MNKSVLYSSKRSQVTARQHRRNGRFGWLLGETRTKNLESEEATVSNSTDFGTACSGAFIIKESAVGRSKAPCSHTGNVEEQKEEELVKHSESDCGSEYRWLQLSYPEDTGTV